MTPSDGATLAWTGQTDYTPPQPSASDNRIPSKRKIGSSTRCPHSLQPALPLSLINFTGASVDNLFTRQKSSSAEKGTAPRASAARIWDLWGNTSGAKDMG